LLDSNQRTTDRDVNEARGVEAKAEAEARDVEAEAEAKARGVEAKAEAEATGDEAEFEAELFKAIILLLMWPFRIDVT
jgi:regulator of protease activity HflC (stomatin/prohibitin superfamily)